MSREQSNPPPGSQITIREAVEDDLPQLKQMIEALAEYHGDKANVDLDALKRDIFGEHPWIFALVAEQERVLSGYVALCPLVRLQFNTRGLDMHHLFVADKARRLGLGRELIKASISKARTLGCQYMMVNTHPDNSTAQAFYLSCGFESRNSASPGFRIAVS